MGSIFTNACHRHHPAPVRRRVRAAPQRCAGATRGKARTERVCSVGCHACRHWRSVPPAALGLRFTPPTGSPRSTPAASQAATWLARAGLSSAARVEQGPVLMSAAAMNEMLCWLQGHVRRTPALLHTTRETLACAASAGGDMNVGGDGRATACAVCRLPCCGAAVVVGSTAVHCAGHRLQRNCHSRALAVPVRGAGDATASHTAAACLEARRKHSSRPGSPSQAPFLAVHCRPPNRGIASILLGPAPAKGVHDATHVEIQGRDQSVEQVRAPHAGAANLTHAASSGY